MAKEKGWNLTDALKKEKKAISIKDYADLKSFLLSEQGI